jgi:quinol monooxygenase YgiN
MSDEVSWWVEIAVKAGQHDEFLALTGEMVIVTKAESGVLSYQRFMNEDGTVIHVHERYANSDAALAHLHTFSEKFAARFSSMVSRTRFTVYGNVSEELRSVLNGFGATSYFQRFGDFEYWA